MRGTGFDIRDFECASTAVLPLSSLFADLDILVDRTLGFVIKGLLSWLLTEFHVAGTVQTLELTARKIGHHVLGWISRCVHVCANLSVLAANLASSPMSAQQAVAASQGGVPTVE